MSFAIFLQNNIFLIIVGTEYFYMVTEKWKLLIEWFDEKTYSELPSGIQQNLKDFRKRTHYIEVLSKTVSKDEKELRKLKDSIKKRREKIRIHQLRGKSYYEKLEPFKSKHELDVYYSEGVRSKKVNTKQGKVNIHKYSQTNLKFKSQFLSNPKTISLKSTRRETITFLKDVCPKWYREMGERLVFESDSVKVKRGMVDLFKPIVIELVEKNRKRFKDTGFSITFQDLVDLMKTKHL